MAGKKVSMTAEEIRKTYGKDEAKAMAMARAAPEEIHDINPGGKSVARGFATFREHINKKGRPKTRDKKVKISIRLPESYVTRLRSVDGYSTIISDYVIKGLAGGAINIPQDVKKKKRIRMQHKVFAMPHYPLSAGPAVLSRDIRSGEMEMFCIIL
jgi:hypothetical protein